MYDDVAGRRRFSNNVLNVIGRNALVLRHRMKESAELAAILRAVDSGARLTRQLLLRAASRCIRRSSSCGTQIRAAAGGVQLESDAGVGTTVSYSFRKALAVSEAIVRPPVSQPAEAA